MCGIVGALTRSGRPADADVALMRDRLHHRGPDSSGLWSDLQAGVVLGHRRLAVIDRSSAGAQPMISATGRYVLTFNGEIYNFRELRRELSSSGHAFRGHSDTEVFVAALDRWGLAETLRRSVGMFAAGCWDRRDRRLWLFRDRMGEKPLYVAKAADALLFASELGALTAWPGLQTTLDPSAVSAFFQRGYVPAPLSIWREVRKLEPGCVLDLAAHDLDLPDLPIDRSRPYWSLAEVAADGLRNPARLSDEDAVTAGEHVLFEAVAGQSVADVPLGVFLSGGVDSSLVLALLQKATGRPARTFTVGFGQDGYDESAAAERVARCLGAEHVELQVTAEQMLADIPRLARIFDEPFADPSQLPTLIVAELARRHVTVVLSGDGGDELFGGYDRYTAAARLAALLAIPRGLRRPFAGLIDAVGGSRLERVVAVLPPDLRERVAAATAGDRMRKLALALAADGRPGLVRSFTTLWGDPSEIVVAPPAVLSAAERAAGVPKLDDVRHDMMLEDALGWLPDDILVKVDRATMAVSLESRAPFLDHRVVEFAWRLPLHQKIRNGQKKWVLRQILRRHLPPALVERPKMGFRPPIGAWLRGPLRDWAEALLDRTALAHSGLLRESAVLRCWRELIEGRRARADQVWAVLAFQAWLEARQRSSTGPRRDVAFRPPGAAERRTASEASACIGS